MSCGKTIKDNNFYPFDINPMWVASNSNKNIRKTTNDMQINVTIPWILCG